MEAELKELEKRWRDTQAWSHWLAWARAKAKDDKPCFLSLTDLCDVFYKQATKTRDMLDAIQHDTYAIEGEPMGEEGIPRGPVLPVTPERIKEAQQAQTKLAPMRDEMWKLADACRRATRPNTPFLTNPNACPESFRFMLSALDGMDARRTRHEKYLGAPSMDDLERWNAKVRQDAENGLAKQEAPFVSPTEAPAIPYRKPRGPTGQPHMDAWDREPD